LWNPTTSRSRTYLHPPQSSNPPTHTPESALTRWLTPLINLASHPSLNLLQRPHEHAFPELVEANVRAQVANVCRSEVIQRAWATAAEAQAAREAGEDVDVDTYASSGKDVKMVHVHGWVYELETGRLRDLGISCGPEEIVGHKHERVREVQEEVQASVGAAL
jgi:carbonic anhydrase